LLVVLQDDFTAAVLTLLHLTFEQAAISGDIAAMEVLLNKGSDATFTQAQDIYEQGSFSKTYAEIQLDSGAVTKIDADTVVSVTIDGSTVIGAVMDDVPVGTKAVSIQYKVSEQGGYNCNVGGNPTPVLDGCKLNSL
jgi:hypothetical protein